MASNNHEEDAVRTASKKHLYVCTWALDSQAVFNPLVHASAFCFHPDDFTAQEPTLIETIPIKAVSQVICGGNHTLCLSNDGKSLVSWGDVSWTLGQGLTRANLCPQPGIVKGLPSCQIIKCVAAGNSHSVAVTEQGQAYSWGLNLFGELGLGHQNIRMALHAMQVVLPQDVALVSVACGAGFSVGLCDRGLVYCWGRQVGPKQNQANICNATLVDGIENIRLIAAGWGHIGAVDNAKGVWMWGKGDYGQLSNGSTDDNVVPTKAFGPINTSTITAIAAGASHTLFLTDDGGVWSCGGEAIGANGSGLCRQLIAHRIENIPQMSSIVCGRTESFAVTLDRRSVWHWGPAVPCEYTSLNNCGEIVCVAVGNDHGVAVVNDWHQRVDQEHCYTLQWGTANHSLIARQQLTKSNTSAPLNMNKSIFPHGIRGLDVHTIVSHVACGSQHTVVLGGGIVYCLGDGRYGQLGAFIQASETATPISTALDQPVVFVAAGGDHSIAIVQNGSVYSWGRNSDGQLGVAGPEFATGHVNIHTPTRMSLPENVAAVNGSCGGAHTLIVVDTGEVYACGKAANGRLGSAAAHNQWTPQPIEYNIHQNPRISSTACGWSHSLMLTENGEVYSFGKGYPFGQLGHAAVEDVSTPRMIEAIHGVGMVQIAGGYNHSMAISGKGEVYGWGGGNMGQLGLGDTVDHPQPMKIQSLLGTCIVHVAAGASHTIAISDEGEMFTWGKCGGGESGLGSQAASSTPKSLVALKWCSWRLAAAGNECSVAVARKWKHQSQFRQGVCAWGKGENGLLGQPSADLLPQLLPLNIQILEGEPISLIATGKTVSLAASADRVWMWGSNEEIFGSTKISLPTIVVSKRKVSSIAVGSKHCLCVCEGSILAWGDNSDGQCGVGFEPGMFQLKTPHPVDMGGLVVTAVSAGSFHSMAIADKGKLYLWGRGKGGRLGHMTTEKCWTPKKLLFSKPIVAMCCGWRHSLAITKDGVVWAWGKGKYGELGLGNKLRNTTPKPIDIPGIESPLNFVAVAAAERHSLGLTDTGVVYSWGNGDFGQLGHGDRTEILSPKEIVGLPKASLIAAGGFHSLVAAGDLVFAFGKAQCGELGLGTRNDQDSPVIIDCFGQTCVTALSCGLQHSLALITAEKDALDFLSVRVSDEATDAALELLSAKHRTNDSILNLMDGIEQQMSFLGESGGMQGNTSMAPVRGSMAMRTSMAAGRASMAPVRGSVAMRASVGLVRLRDSMAYLLNKDKQPDPVILHLKFNRGGGLMTEQCAELIEGVLPSRIHHSSLRPVYSSVSDGFSLSTFNRKAERSENTVLLIQAKSGEVFGCYCPEKWTKKTHDIMRESFVFSIIPRRRAYPWTHIIEPMRLCNDHTLAIGGGGTWAFWIDMFNQVGGTATCETYGNRPLVEKEAERFQIATIELWGIF